jgi:hypothetical protein
VPQIGSHGKASSRRALIVGVVASILVLRVGGVQWLRTLQTSIRTSRLVFF